MIYFIQVTDRSRYKIKLLFMCGQQRPIVLHYCLVCDLHIPVFMASKKLLSMECLRVNYQDLYP